MRPTEQDPETVHLARRLRARLTPTERMLWKFLRNRQLLGLKFRRQQPMGRFIADFYCDELRVVIEVDGSVHDVEERAAQDEAREAAIASMGVRVIRVRAEEINASVASVVTRLRGELGE